MEVPTVPQRFFQSLALQCINASEDSLNGILLSFVSTDEKMTLRNALKAERLS